MLLFRFVHTFPNSAASELPRVGSSLATASRCAPVLPLAAPLGCDSPRTARSHPGPASPRRPVPAREERGVELDRTEVGKICRPAAGRCAPLI